MSLRRSDLKGNPTSPERKKYTRFLKFQKKILELFEYTKKLLRVIEKSG